MSTTDAGVLVGLDAGGSYVKATVFDLAAGSSATANWAVTVDRPEPGHNERDAEELWRATAHVVRDALSRIPGAAQRVVAVGVTGHGNGAYLVDAHGRPTRAAIQASDTRASAMVRDWDASGVPDKLRARVWNGLWPGQPGPLLSWLAEHEPDMLEDSAALLMCGDYLRARLTGTLTGELTAWSCNGLIDSTIPEVSDDALAAYGIEHLRRLLPPLVPHDAVVGVVTSGASAATGLPVGTPVIGGAVDNVTLQLGAGVVDGSRILVGAGTWSINQLLVPRAAMTMDGPLGAVEPYAACLAVPTGLALLIEASATSASTLGWALERVVRGVAATAVRLRENVYTHALAQVATRPLRDDAPMFLPYLDGSRDRPTARGAWLGMSSGDDDTDLLAATVEGICLEHRRHIERLSRATPHAVPLRLAGGAGRSAAWAQTFADTTGRAVEVSPVEELGAAGAAVIAGTAVGAFSSIDDGLSHLNPVQRSFYPRQEVAEFYERRYQRYLRWAEAMETDPWLTPHGGSH